MSTNTLLNPKGLLSKEEFSYIAEKLNVTKMITSRSPERGGSPFVYSFSISKKHILDDDLKTTFKNGKTHYTVGTDGESYFWHPELLKNFSVKEINILLIHETYHIILGHADPRKIMDKDPDIWGIAIDYAVNAMIEHDFIKNGWIKELENSCDCEYDNCNCDYDYEDEDYDNPHPIWSGSFGGRISFKALKQSINKIKNGKPIFDNQIIKTFADYSLHGKSAEQIYDEIIDLLKNEDDSINQTKNDLLNQINATSLDDHTLLKVIPDNILHKEMLEATTLSKQMGQSLPGEIERQLLKLQNPSLRWEDIVKMLFQNFRKNFGNKNDWSRFRRRGLSKGLYIPSKKDRIIKWVALIDTSGSVNEENISYALSQLKVMDGRSTGTVIPIDSEVYWDKAVSINNISDLSKTKIVGGGGTYFSDFFDNYKKKLKDDFDVLIILTDGLIWDIKNLKKPHCETVWVIDNKYYGLEGYKFDPLFGRIAPVRRN
jgi:predicted metal-dependent peptidase